MVFDFAEPNRQVASIRVVGVGGGGGNAINRMIQDNMKGVEFLALNTDIQALDQNKAPYRIQLGKNLTKGLGAGGNPEIGRKAIEESKEAVSAALSNSDMVFITAGMGGGTGTGAAPVVAEIAKDLKALTVGIVTRPFEFEGRRRLEKAEQGIEELRKHVDTLIVVPNHKLLSLVPKNMPFDDALGIADEILLFATRGISDVINLPGLINVDFADVEAIMNQSGDAHMGSGIASGENRAHEAAEKAIKSQLIENMSIEGAQGVLINITGGKDLSLNDVSEATTLIHDTVGDDANIIFGAVVDPEMNGELRVTLIATGFHSKESSRRGSRDEKRRRPERGPRDIPFFNSYGLEPLEKTMGEILGSDGDALLSKTDLDIPAFIRKSAG
jgi:cell division protein FtsZ